MGVAPRRPGRHDRQQRGAIARPRNPPEPHRSAEARSPRGRVAGNAAGESVLALAVPLARSCPSKEVLYALLARRPTCGCNVSGHPPRGLAAMLSSTADQASMRRPEVVASATTGAADPVVS